MLFGLINIKISSMQYMFKLIEEPENATRP